MVITLKPIGFYEEFGGRSWNGSIHHTISTTPNQHEERILDYLRQGIAIRVTTHIARDVVATIPVPICAPHYLTDGVWMWPQTLIYYIEKYHCRLPAEFLQYLENIQWQFPDHATINEDMLLVPK